jgi:hypothetical protein
MVRTFVLDRRTTRILGITPVLIRDTKTPAINMYRALRHVHNTTMVHVRVTALSPAAPRPFRHRMCQALPRWQHLQNLQLL